MADDIPWTEDERAIPILACFDLRLRQRRDIAKIIQLLPCHLRVQTSGMAFMFDDTATTPMMHESCDRSFHSRQAEVKSEDDMSSAKDCPQPQNHMRAQASFT